MSSEPSLLQADQAQLSQPVLVGEVFHPLDHLGGPLLDPFQCVNVPLTLETTELDIVLQVWPHQQGVMATGEKITGPVPSWKIPKM